MRILICSANIVTSDTNYVQKELNEKCQQLEDEGNVILDIVESTCCKFTIKYKKAITLRMVDDK